MNLKYLRCQVWGCGNGIANVCLHTRRGTVYVCGDHCTQEFVILYEKYGSKVRQGARNQLELMQVHAQLPPSLSLIESWYAYLPMVKRSFVGVTNLTARWRSRVLACG